MAAGDVGVDGAAIVSGELKMALVDPLLSVAVTVILKDPAWLYEWVSDVAEAGSVSGDDPSPQLTVKEDIVPSGSVLEKDIVIGWPVVVELAEGVLIFSTGGRSLIVSDCA